MTVAAKITETPGRGWRWSTEQAGATVDQGVTFYASSALAEAAGSAALGTNWPGTPTEAFATITETESAGWHYVGSGGGEPAFQNSWANVPSWTALAFRRLTTGKVALEGIIGNGTSDETIFTLPAGYRPSENTHYTAVAVGAAYYPVFVSVLTTGAVSVAYSAGDIVVLSGEFWLDPPVGTPAP